MDGPFAIDMEQGVPLVHSVCHPTDLRSLHIGMESEVGLDEIIPDLLLDQWKPLSAAFHCIASSTDRVLEVGLDLEQNMAFPKTCLAQSVCVKRRFCTADQTEGATE